MFLMLLVLLVLLLFLLFLLLSFHLLLLFTFAAAALLLVLLLFLFLLLFHWGGFTTRGAVIRVVRTCSQEKECDAVADNSPTKKSWSLEYIQ